MALLLRGHIDIVAYPSNPPITAVVSISASEPHKLARGKAIPSPLPLVTAARNPSA